MYAYCENDPVNNIDPDGYLSLGRNWWNSVVWVSRIIDALIIFIPLLAGISKALKYGGTIKAIVSGVLKTTNAELRKMVGQMAMKLSFRIGVPLIASSLLAVFDIVLILSGTSVGGIVATILDKVDGKVDGYIYA